MRSVVLGRIATGRHVRWLEQRLATYFGAPAAIACGSGRVALELALRAVGVSSGDEVIVPTFCCTSILPPITALGAMPVFADVNEDLHLTAATVEAACTSSTRAVVVAHLFGNPAPIREISDLCRRRGIAVIDDAAQALGGRLEGQLLGTFGDVGLVSFGNGKVCFGTGGGVLISRRADILARARSVPLDGDLASLALLRKVARVVFWRRWRRWTLPARPLLSRLGCAGTGSKTEGRVPMSNIDAAVASTLLDTLDENLAARRARVDFYRRRLADIPGIRLVAHDPGSACLTQVVEIAASRLDADPAAALLGDLRVAGYEVDSSYQPLHGQTGGAGNVAHFPVAEGLWRRLIELPCEPSVSLDEAARIAAVIEAGVRRPTGQV